MTFERFTKYPPRHRPGIAIFRNAQNAQIRFNAAALKKYNLAEFSYVILFFNRATREIGFRFLKTKENDTFKFYLNQPSRSTGVINCNSFLKYYEIETTPGNHYDLTYHETLDLYIA